MSTSETNLLPEGGEAPRHRGIFITCIAGQQPDDSNIRHILVPGATLHVSYGWLNETAR